MNRPDDDQRSVETGAEALGQKVVGVAGRRARGVRTLVRAAEVQREVGNGGGEDERERGGGEDAGVTPDESRPSLPSAFDDRRLGAISGQRTALPATQDVVLLETQERGQQREGGEHRDQHGHRRRDGDAVEERESKHQHAEQGDADRRAGEEHRSSRGVERRDHRVLDAEAPFEALSAARDDEERVVDADTQSDQ